MDAGEEGGSTFLKADEVDEAGPGNVGLDLSQQQQPGVSPEPPLDTAEQINAITSNSSTTPGKDGATTPIRPPLKRDKWAPAPQQPPPPAPPKPTEESETPMDSLSLMQLKKLVLETPKTEPTPYAFMYEDCSYFEEELEEFFGYSAFERMSLARLNESFLEQFQDKFEHDASQGWSNVNDDLKIQFLKFMRKEMSDPDQRDRASQLECLCYLALGNWWETALLEDDPGVATDQERRSSTRNDAMYRKSQRQVAAIKENVSRIAQYTGIDKIVSAARDACYGEIAFFDLDLTDDESNPKFIRRCEAWAGLVLLYLLVDLGRRDGFGELGPSFDIDSTALDILNFLTDVLKEMRWNESVTSHPLKILCLYWKTMLLVFGGRTHVKDIKNKVNGEQKIAKQNLNERHITASPLDYHMFRQEIISKYPAFNPPTPIFPFEPENTSIVPPLHEAVTRDDGAGPANVHDQSSSIIHQPVHIATPAPSPPPSPAGPGGKGVKKQNYQTNQMFPFLYPPLEDPSNASEGKDNAGLQNIALDKKWNGSDIPTSIREAADLFAERMRATRSMKQLWEEREKFLKYERGYESFDSYTRSKPEPQSRIASDEFSDSFGFSALSHDEQRRLLNVDRYYDAQLPKLQSVVIVLLKVLLQTVTTLVTQPNTVGGLQNGLHSGNQNGKANGNGQAAKDQKKQASALLMNLDLVRSQEIMGKAVSGILLILLKWFKVSHILKFEYLSQLLLDSNYIQLILKLFTHQELERVVNYKCERPNMNFFQFCKTNARNHETPGSSEDEKADGDDAMPPPIQPRRRNNTTGTHETTNSAVAAPGTSVAAASAAQQQQQQQQQGQSEQQQPSKPNEGSTPAVDEFGNAISEAPTAPITEYSWRNFFTNINHLRILQKVVKAKPYRQLLMTQYKYSNIIKKSLKVPQPDIRLYTLKIIKGQVPYCHRKWRQSNMRIITAIYLHCKPELRDEWLAGVDADHEMSDAVPLEQALRSLTFFYNLRRYPGSMGRTRSKRRAVARWRARRLRSSQERDGGQEDEEDEGDEEEKEDEELSEQEGEESIQTEAQWSMLQEERDFFVRELEMMEIFADEASSGGHEASRQIGGKEGGMEGSADMVDPQDSSLDAPVQMDAW